MKTKIKQIEKILEQFLLQNGNDCSGWSFWSLKEKIKALCEVQNVPFNEPAFRAAALEFVKDGSLKQEVQNGGHLYRPPCNHRGGHASFQ